MISMCHGRAEVHHVMYPLSAPPALLTSPTQWSCNRHMVSKHHFFISYRVATESTLAHKLFGLVELKKPGTVAFLDANCLPHALDWQESFERGLKYSSLSEASLEKVKANAQQFKDNVLLEMELALARKHREPEGTVAIFPVFVVIRNVNGANKSVYADFSFPNINYFPDVAHARGFALPDAPATIRETISKVFLLNGVFVNPADKGLFELLHMLFQTLDKVNAVRKEFLLDPAQP